MTLPITGCLFGRASQINRTHHCPLFRINHRRIGLTVAQNVNPLCHRLKQDPVGPPLLLTSSTLKRPQQHSLASFLSHLFSFSTISAVHRPVQYQRVLLRASPRPALTELPDGPPHPQASLAFIRGNLCKSHFIFKY